MTGTRLTCVGGSRRGSYPELPPWVTGLFTPLGCSLFLLSHAVFVIIPWIHLSRFNTVRKMRSVKNFPWTDRNDLAIFKGISILIRQHFPSWSNLDFRHKNWYDKNGVGGKKDDQEEEDQLDFYIGYFLLLNSKFRGAKNIRYRNQWILNNCPVFFFCPNFSLLAC